MNKLNQNGRSMLEMMGVLAIIGVISVGGLHIFNQGQSAHKMAQLIADTADLARMAKKLSCQYDNGYSSYTQYLYKSNAYPNNLKYNSGTKKFTGIFDAVYEIEGNDTYFNIALSKLSEEACMKVLTNDWGNRRSSGFMGVTINNHVSYAAGKVNINIAADNCNGNNNVILLRYNGCRN